MVYFKENNFPRFQSGSNIFSGAGVSNFFQSGPFAYSIRKPITCVFPGGGGGVSGPLHPPLNLRMEYLDQLDTVTKVRY